MSNESTINEEYYPMLIGDILLHSEQKLSPILVISQPLIIRTSQTNNEIVKIPSVSINAPRIAKNSTGILCDLKNTTTTGRSTHERVRSFKKFTRLHQVGWTFIKTMKLRVMKSSQHPSNLHSQDKKQTVF